MKGRYELRIKEGRCPRCGRDEQHTQFEAGKVTCTQCLGYQRNWNKRNGQVIQTRRGAATIARSCCLCNQPTDEGMVVLSNVNSKLWLEEWGTDTHVTTHYSCLTKFMLAGV